MVVAKCCQRYTEWMKYLEEVKERADKCGEDLFGRQEEKEEI